MPTGHTIVLGCRCINWAASRVRGRVHRSCSSPRSQRCASLPQWVKGRTYYRSTLRAKVRQLDPAKSLTRTFPDKDEWRSVLKQLQDEGILSYNSERDEIIVPVTTE